MADEENPLGGGPFGVGPFGPLVATAAAAVAAFSMVTVTTVKPVTRTLFYQANIVPPPTAALQAAAFEPAPDKWMPRWQGPPKYQPNRGPFAAGPIEPPAVVVVEDNINAATGITTGGVRSKSLFYQAKVEPITPPTAAVVIADIAWHAPFSAPPPRKLLIQRSQNQPFIPALAVPVTVDEWLPSWQGQPRRIPPKIAAQPFIPRAAVLENTVTPDNWLQPFYKAVARPPVNHTQPFYGYPYVAASNLTTTLEWQIAWQGPPRRLQRLQPGQAFVPKEAVLENTITPDKWLFRPQKAVPRQPVWATQPFYGYPYVSAPTLTTTLEWLSGWQKAVPVRRPVVTQPFYGYPYVGVATTLTTTLEWMPAWPQSPPRRPVRHTQPWAPFQYYQVDTCVGAFDVPAFQFDAFQVCRQEIKGWFIPLSEPKARARLNASQITYTFPPVAVPTVAWQQPLSSSLKAARPVTTQPGFVYSPAAAVTLTTTLEWLPGWQKAVPPRPVWHTQPFYGYPYLSLPNLTTSIEWLSGWQKAVPHGWPRYAAVTFPPYPYEAAVQVTVEKWLLRWQGPPRYLPPRILAQPFVPRAAVLENTVTPEKWVYRFQKAVPPRPVHRTQPFYGYPYQDEYPTGGPADESERVVCVPVDPRLATVPDALRVATVPVQDRVATVPELLRVAEVPEQSRVVNSNEYRDRPC